MRNDTCRMYDVTRVPNYDQGGSKSQTVIQGVNKLIKLCICSNLHHCPIKAWISVKMGLFVTVYIFN